MKAATTQFKQSAADTLSDARIQDSLRGLYSGFSKARERAGEATPGWEEMRTRAQAVKTHTIANLDYYLEQVEARVTESGVTSSSRGTASRRAGTSSTSSRGRASGTSSRASRCCRRRWT